MEDLRQYFSSESIEKLEQLNKLFQNADHFSDSEKREIFRTLHTIKGSSQTFGFNTAGNLAHKLESILFNSQNENFFASQPTENLFIEGIELLIKSLEEKHFQIPASFVEKINALIPESIEKNNFSETFSSKIPVGIYSQLASDEKKQIASAFDKEEIIYGLEVGFDLSNFAAEFKKLRETLSRAGEIIAALPSAKFAALKKIGFQIIFVTSQPFEKVREIAENGKAQIIFDSSEPVFANDLHGVLSQIVEHGKEIAAKLDKQIEFIVSSDEIKLSPQKLKLIFDVLLHLTRNAVDHAIVSAGTIEISVKIKDNNLNFSISDNGRGIDSEKIKAGAIEKNLISENAKLSENETVDLIFLPGFSTASELTEISGRGIGLDAVKNAVESANGKINVKTESEKGTTFEVFLPLEN